MSHGDAEPPIEEAFRVPHFRVSQLVAELRAIAGSVPLGRRYWIGLTGAPGSGKTTLLDLIMGFDAPNEGKILIDGEDLSTLDRSSMRAQIGLVPQRGVLFTGTLLENMTLFREGRATDDALELVERLGMQETITRLPNGLQTLVGETGGNALSEGFRQRVIMDGEQAFWQADPHFHLDNHLHEIGLPGDADRAALSRLAGDLASTPLDRYRVNPAAEG